MIVFFSSERNDHIPPYPGPGPLCSPCELNARECQSAARGNSPKNKRGPEKVAEIDPVYQFVLRLNREVGKDQPAPSRKRFAFSWIK